MESVFLFCYDPGKCLSNLPTSSLNSYDNMNLDLTLAVKLHLLTTFLIVRTGLLILKHLIYF